MKIIVKNLGPIREAKFDIDKRLSVFCGPNNTGKTYLSYILYAFTRRRIYLPEEILTDRQVKAFMDSRLLEIKMDLNRVYKVMKERFYNISHDLSTIFGISDSMAATMFPDFKIDMDMGREAYKRNLLAQSLDFTLNLNPNITIQVSKRSGEDLLSVKNMSSKMLLEDRAEVKVQMMTAIYYYIIISPVLNSHFFPVERTSLYTYYKDILGTRNLLLDKIHQQGAEDPQTLNRLLSSSSQFPLVISQTLQAASSMERQRHENGYYSQLADEIERDVLHGEVSVGNEGDLRFVSEKSPKTVLPLQLSASMTKAVAGIVFYLRHNSDRGDMIFIDEPEVNCHPDVQILMTRIFARMINAGLRLVISTHSDYIIREINNLIMLSKAPVSMAETLTKWGYQKEMAIEYQDVGAYLFSYGKDNKVEVSPIEVTEAGFEVSSIDATISLLNETSQALYYELRYGQKG